MNFELTGRKRKILVDQEIWLSPPVTDESVRSLLLTGTRSRSFLPLPTNSIKRCP